jgi:hypothetical protein
MKERRIRGKEERRCFVWALLGMYLSGVLLFKDVMGEILKRLGPRDLVAFGCSCSAARLVTRNSKAVRLAVTEVLQQCHNRKKVRKLQKKRLHPWAVLTMWTRGMRFEQQHLRAERDIFLAVMELGRAQIGGRGWDDPVTAIRVFSRFEFSITYSVDTQRRTVECVFVECFTGANRKPEVSVTCSDNVRNPLVLRNEGLLGATLRNRMELFSWGASHTQVRWWKL